MSLTGRLRKNLCAIKLLLLTFHRPKDAGLPPYPTDPAKIHHPTFAGALRLSSWLRICAASAADPASEIARI